MKYDLTTQVDVGLMEQWLSTKENRHLATGHVGTHNDNRWLGYPTNPKKVLITMN